MIATVRIAPVERWCKCHDELGDDPSAQALVGLEVQIKTDTMTVRSDHHDTPTRFWRLTEESARKFDAAQGYAGRDYSQGYFRVCEHMLEMD